MKSSIHSSIAGLMGKSRGAVLVGLMLASFTAVSEEVDARQVIQLNDAQREHVLGEMRTMLSGMQRILAALAVNDMAEAAKQARLLGMANKHKAENTVHDALPPAFMQMGMPLHRAFDDIAAEMDAGADRSRALAQLSQAMNACNNCHEIYQIQRVAGEQPNHSANQD